MRTLLHLSFYILTFTLTVAAQPSNAIPAHVSPSIVNRLPSIVTKDTLPPPDSLFLSLHRYHDQQLQAQLAEFQISERGAWLKYIPSIGVGYSLGTDAAGNVRNVLRPSLSYNTNIIYRVRQDKEMRRAKISAIQQASTLAFANDKRQLELLLRQHQNALAELNFMQQLHQIDTELFEIATVQFAATEIPPSKFLPQKRAFLQKQYELLQQRQRVEQLATEIRVMAKY